MDDVRAVMDAVGSERAALLGVSEGGPMSALFAATYPERTSALVLYGTFAAHAGARLSMGHAEDEYRREIEEEERAWGTPEHAAQAARTSLRARRGGEAGPCHRCVRARAPARRSPAPDEHRDRRPPGAVSDSCPTLVVNRTGDDLSITGGSRLAEHIPGATIELPGADHASLPERGDDVAEEIERFLRATWEERAWEDGESDRVLATVLFTDIVGSTARAASSATVAGGAARRPSRRRPPPARAFRGRELDTAGDGFFASFDGPARAIRCACAIVESVRELDLEVRAGLHAGECELMDGKVAGIAVHIGARVAAQADRAKCWSRAR